MADTTKKHNTVSQADQDEIAAKRRKTEAENPAVSAGGTSIPLPLSTSSPALLGLLFKTSVASVMPNLEGRLYTCHRQDSLTSCFKGLEEHRVTSCPVMTKDKRPKFFNFLEIWDVVEFVVNHFQSSKPLSDPGNFWELVKQEEAFNSLTVNDVTKFPTSRKRFDSLPLPMDYSVLFAAELMMREKNLHRLAVVENVETRVIKSIITQSRIVQFIHDNIEALGDRRHRVVAEFPGCFAPVLTIDFKSPAINAFTSMAKEGFMGLPVVDEKNQLHAVISMNDIKGMAIDGSLFWRLYNDVWSFLDKMKRDYPNVPRPSGPIYCKKTDTLESVISLFVAKKIHRLPIVNSDADKTVIGIVTLRDVLKACLMPW